MASIEELLKGNPYKDIFAPIIGAYNNTQLVTPNPHEVWLAATIIEMRTQYWGTNMPVGEPNEFQDGGGGGGAGANHCCVKNPKTCSCKGSASAGARAAGGSGAANPVTTRIETLEKELRTIDMSQTNAWQYWSKAVDAFYNNIGPMISFFKYTYKEGRYADFYKSALSIFNHPDGNDKGLSFSLYQEGTVTEPYVMFITFDLADISLADRFFIVYDELGQSYMLYYDLDGAGTFVPPIVTDFTLPIAIVTGDVQKEILAATLGVLDSTGAFTLKITDLLLRITVKNNGVVTDYNEGTSLIGINYEFNDELIASDLSVLASGITDPIEYANAWNTLRVPYEATLGNTYPYLNPDIIDVGSPVSRNGSASPCGACFRAVGIPVYGRDPSGSGTSPDSTNGPTGCKGCSSGASSSAFRATAYDMFTNTTFNTPGNIFNTTEGRQRRLTPLP